MPFVIMRVMVGGEESIGGCLVWFVFAKMTGKFFFYGVFPLLIVERQETAMIAVDVLVRQAHRLHPL